MSPSASAKRQSCRRDASGSLHDPALKKEYDDNMKEQLSKKK
jgi:hypothetical protein